MIGRLMRNTDPHQKCSRRKPDATGPTAAPLPEMPAQIAIAFARSRAGKTLVRIESVDGMTNAAPTPMIARAAISIADESASAPSSDPAPKISRPACSAPLRPNRSPRAAAVNNSPAKTRPYASTIHWIAVFVAPRPPADSGSWRVGSATLSTVLPTMTMTSDAQSTASVFQRFA